MDTDFTQRLCAPVETPRLLVQPLTAAHAPEAFAPLQDDALYAWMSERKPASVEALVRNWRRLESRLSPDGQQAWPTWAVISRTTGTLLGRVDAVIESDGVCSNFGYYLFPAYWGLGFASEAVGAVIDHLLSLGLPHVVATVTVGNVASVRVLEKAGFTFTRIIQDNDTVRGVLVDDAEYVLLNH